ILKQEFGDGGLALVRQRIVVGVEIDGKWLGGGFVAGHQVQLGSTKGIQLAAAEVMGVEHPIMPRPGARLGGGEAIHVMTLALTLKELVRDFGFDAAGEGCDGEYQHDGSESGSHSASRCTTMSAAADLHQSV